LGLCSNTFANDTGCDTRLFRDAANVLAQRNAANAQTFRIYNTFTSTTNFERLNIIAQSAGSVIIGTEKGSAGGTARALEFQTDGVTRATLGAAGGLTLASGSVTVPLLGGTFTITSGAVMDANAFRAGSNGALIFTSGTGGSGGSFDTELNREAAGVFRIRSQAGAATGLILYNTLSIATNYERGFLRWTSNVLQIGTEKLGTGTAQGMELRTDNTARLTIGSAGTVTLNTTLAADAQNISTDTTTGTKIGTSTSQKIGFFNATPVVQQAAVADATDAASVITQLNALLARLRTLGLIAT
jgi:hypothetical protein